MHGWLRPILFMHIVTGSVLFGTGSLEMLHHLGDWNGELYRSEACDTREAALQLHLEVKSRVVDDVVAGRLSVDEAGEIFAQLHHDRPICTTRHLRLCFAPTEPEMALPEIFRRQVRAFVEFRQRNRKDRARAGRTHFE